MHSISNWKPAGEVALALANKYKAGRFVLVYDQEENKATMQSASNLFCMLNGYLVDVAIWNKEYGKGIDDVINAGYIKKISRVSAEKYFNNVA